MIDADEELVFSEPFRLDKKCIFIPVHLRNSVFKRPFLVDLTLNWRWKGAVHERIELSMPFTSACLANAYIISHEDGDRSRDMAAKFLKDAQMLEAALKKEPNNGRLVLLLAQSYSLANQLERALHTYQKRVRMGGSEEEIFYALYAVAQHERMLGRFSIESFYRAYRFRPERAEPISWIASHYLERGQFEKAYAILKEAILISYPNDMIYVEPAIYDYVLLAQLADSAWKLKKFNEAKELFLKLLANPKVPEDLKTRIQGLTKSAF